MDGGTRRQGVGVESRMGKRTMASSLVLRNKIYQTIMHPARSVTLCRCWCQNHNDCSIRYLAVLYNGCCLEAIMLYATQLASRPSLNPAEVGA